MRYFVHYIDWTDAPASLRFFRADVNAAVRRSRKGNKVGVRWVLKDGRLTAHSLSVANHCGTLAFLPLTQEEGQMLTPLSVRQALWEEAMTQALAAGVIAATALRPQDAASLGGAPDEDHE